MRVEEIKWLPNAGYTGMGLWRVFCRDENNQRTHRDYARWRGRDELAIYTLVMKETQNERGTN